MVWLFPDLPTDWLVDVEEVLVLDELVLVLLPMVDVPVPPFALDVLAPVELLLLFVLSPVVAVLLPRSTANRTDVGEGIFLRMTDCYWCSHCPTDFRSLNRRSYCSMYCRR